MLPLLPDPHFVTIMQSVHIHHQPPFFAIQHPAGWTMDMLSVSIATEHGLHDSLDGTTERTIEDRGVVHMFRDCSIQLAVVASTDHGLLFDCIVTNTSDDDLRILSISPVRYNGDWHSAGVFNVAADSWIDVYPAERCYGYHGPQPVLHNHPAASCWFFSTHNDGSEGTFVAGIAAPPGGFFRFHCVPMQASQDGRRVLRWSCDVDTLSGSRGVRIAPGGSFRTGAFYLGYASERGRVFDDLASLLARHTTDRRVQRSFTGWCSWYAGYRDAIDERTCLENLNAVVRLGTLDFFQIDDGWSTKLDVGDRESGLTMHEFLHDDAAFPRGMGWMAERIREQGLRPGLWLRPFHAAQRGALAPAPDLRSCLDVSSPSALDRIRSLISTVVHQWGYTYLKLDFMTHDFFGCWGMELDSPRPAAFTTSDDTQTNIQIYRRGLEAVREAAGDEVIINACNCLVGPAIGIADVFRIGDDIDADNWDRTFTMGARSVQPMAFLNRTVFLNDPDCVFFHGPLSSEEQRTWMLFVRITGGLRTLGSPATSSVGVTGFFALHDTMQSNLFQSIDHWNNPPSLWRNTNTPFDASDTLVIFNWSRHDRNMRIPLAVLNAGSGPCHVFEWYGSQYLGALRDDFDIAVPAHAVRVLRVRRDSGTPALITLDVDLLADEEGILYESWHAPGTLRIARQLEHPTRAWFVVPEGLSPLLEHGTFTFDGSILMLTLPAGDGIIDIMFKTGHDDTPA